MSDYRPIDCSVHDRLEAFSVLRTPCRIRWRDASGRERASSGRILDVFARAGAEYLRLDDGTEVRLDRLREVEPDERRGG